jgi:alpha-beta hydrolase superfamily lysophospholipase
MKARFGRWMKRGLVLVALVFLTLIGLRAYDSLRGPPLERWHTFVPRELKANELDASDWGRYVAEETRIFETLRKEVTQKLDPDQRVPINRYFEGSPIYPPRFAQDFNRSYVLEPEGTPVGAVVLLHGLTDSPYSQRHIARTYRDRGFVAIAMRVPGHGTVPAGLTDIAWEDWTAATRLAVREARRRTAPTAPLHLVGFSNGGALALKYALDAIDDPRQPMPDRLVLISPMIGITRFARFSGLAELPAYLPAFAKASWIAILPEFNPFKYNSFPVNGARQSHRFTMALQSQIARQSDAGRLVHLPPILTFQSVMDFTVSTSAIVSALYAHLPSNGSELVLFDVNRTIKFGPLLRPSAQTAMDRVLPSGVRSYRTAVITNDQTDGNDAVERVTEAGGTDERIRPLGLAYPAGLFSLSHVALPFPVSDGLYGVAPDPTENFGINLGALAPRGERNVLVASLDALLRVASNPFFPYMIDRIDEGTRSGVFANKPTMAQTLAPVDKASSDVSRWTLDEIRALVTGFLFGEPDAAEEPP